MVRNTQNTFILPTFNNKMFHGVLCTANCVQNPDIVRKFCENKKPPAITLEAGTRFKKEAVEHHFSTLYHQKCKVLLERASMDVLTKENRALMDVHISEAN